MEFRNGEFAKEILKKNKSESVFPKYPQADRAGKKKVRNLPKT